MNIFRPTRIAALVLLFTGCVHADSTNAPASAAPATTPAPAAAPSNSATGVPDDVQKALQLPDGKDRTSALIKAATAWEKQDPRAALTWAFAQPKSPGMDLVRVMANDWGTREPVPAKDWILSQSQSMQNGSLPMFALHLIMTAWARVDPPSAVTWVEGLPANSNIRGIGYYSVADGWAQKEPVGAAAWTAKIPDDADRRNAVAKVSDIWARISKKPQDAAAWAEKLPVDDIKSGAPTIAAAWATTDAAAAKAWVNGLPLTDADKAAILAKIK